MNGGKCVGVGDSASPVGTGSVTRVFRYTAMPTEVCIRDAVTGIEVDVDEPYHGNNDLAWTSVRVENEHSFGQISNLWGALERP